MRTAWQDGKRVQACLFFPGRLRRGGRRSWRTGCASGSSRGNCRRLALLGAISIFFSRRNQVIQKKRFLIANIFGAVGGMDFFGIGGAFFCFFFLLLLPGGVPAAGGGP